MEVSGQEEDAEPLHNSEGRSVNLGSGASADLYSCGLCAAQRSNPCASCSRFRVGHPAPIQNSLSAALAGMRTLTNLDMSGCDLNTAGFFEPVASALVLCPELKTLDIHESDIASDSAIPLCQMLPDCINLQTLSLYETYLGPTAGMMLATALPRSAIESLDVAGCDIRAAAVRIIVESLPQTKLTILDIGNNGGDAFEGPQPLLRSLRQLPAERSLELTAYGLGITQSDEDVDVVRDFSEATDNKVTIYWE
eukprot:COSAG01_NODE_952_length_12499_cov_84.157661_9_plen_252_part_00